MAKFNVTLDTPEGEQVVTVTAANQAEAAAVAQKIHAAKMAAAANEERGNPHEFEGPVDKLLRKADPYLGIRAGTEAAETAEQLYGIEGGDMGQKDRFRHLYWQQHLANKFSPEYAMAAGAAHEVQGLFDPIHVAMKGREQGASWGEIGRESLARMKEIPRDIRTNLSAIAASNNPQNPSAGSAPPNLNQLVIQALLTDTKLEPLTGQVVAGPVYPYEKNPIDVLAEYRKYKTMPDPAMHPLAGMFEHLGKGPKSR